MLVIQVRHRRPCALLAAALILGACRDEADVPLAYDASHTPGGAAPPAIAGADPERGAAAMIQYGCGSCHVIPGVDGASGLVGPTLAGFARRTYVAGRLPNQPPHLVRWIRFPQQVWPGNAMPNLGVTEADARDMAAYLYTLRALPETGVRRMIPEALPGPW